MKSQVSICVSCGQSFEWFPEWYKAKGLQVPPLKCPTCCDQKLSKEAHNIVKERECLHEFPCCDVIQAVKALPFMLVEEQDGRRIKLYHRATIKGRIFGASWQGRIDVFDQRSDPDQPLARVRIMRTKHEKGAEMTGVKVTGPCFPWYSKSTYKWEHSNEWQYVVLDDTDEEEPTCSLIFASAIQKWNRDDYINGTPLWQRSISGSSRTGKHSGQATLAIVDAEHTLSATRVHDHGALHKGDKYVIATASEPVVEALLAKKASKPIDRTTTQFS